MKTIIKFVLIAVMMSVMVPVSSFAVSLDVPMYDQSDFNHDSSDNDIAGDCAPTAAEFSLAVYIPSLDKTFITNEVSRKSFISNYRVDLNADGGAEISETTPLYVKYRLNLLLKALIATLLLEGLFGFLYLSIKKLPKKILISALFGSIVTLPFVWFVFPLIKFIPLAILSSEIFAFIFEAYFIHHFNKKEISLGSSFKLSAIINLASLILGGGAFIFISMF